MNKKLLATLTGLFGVFTALGFLCGSFVNKDVQSVGAASGPVVFDFVDSDFTKYHAAGTTDDDNPIWLDLQPNYAIARYGKGMYGNNVAYTNTNRKIKLDGLTFAYLAQLGMNNSISVANKDFAAFSLNKAPCTDIITTLNTVGSSANFFIVNDFYQDGTKQGRMQVNTGFTTLSADDRRTYNLFKTDASNVLLRKTPEAAQSKSTQISDCGWSYYAGGGGSEVTLLTNSQVVFKQNLIDSNKYNEYDYLYFSFNKVNNISGNIYKVSLSCTKWYFTDYNPCGSIYAYFDASPFIDSSGGTYFSLFGYNLSDPHGTTYGLGVRSALRIFSVDGQEKSINIDTNGGTITNVYNDKYVSSARALSLRLPAVTRKGYIFNGYQLTGGSASYASISNQYNLNLIAGANTDISVQATWVPASYTINFNANGGVNDYNSVNTAYDSINVFTSGGSNVKPKATREGYRFNGYKNSAGNFVIDSNGDVVKGVPNYTDLDGRWQFDNVATLTADWTDTGYNLYFTNNKSWSEVCYYTYDMAWPGELISSPAYTNSLGQEVYMVHLTASQVDSHDEKLIIFNNNDDGKQTEDIKEFVNNRGWYLNDDGYHVSEWTYYDTDVTFNTDGGSSVENATLINDRLMSEVTATVPTKEGYRFLGYFDSNSTQYFNADGTMCKTWDKTDSTCTLYAHWGLENGYYLGGSIVGWAQDGQYKMSENPDKAGEYYVTGVELKAGDEIKAYNQDKTYQVIESVTWSHPDYRGEVTSEHDNCKILADNTYDVYYDPSTHVMHLLVPTEPLNGRYFVLNGLLGKDNLISTTRIPASETLSGYDEYTATIRIYENDYLSSYYQDRTTISHFFPILRNGSVLDWDYVGGRGLKCPFTCEYSLYLISSNKDGIYDQISLTMNGESGATYFASQFNDKFCAICILPEAERSGAISTGWTDTASLFSCLNDDAKALLRTAMEDEQGTDVEKFAAKYDYVYYKYHSSLKLTDYASRSPSYKTSINFINLFTDVTNGNSSNPMLLILIISITTSIAIGSYLLIRKKHEK